MKLFEIKNRFNGKIIFSIEQKSLKLSVEVIINSGADLRNADLRNADLHGANLHFSSGTPLHCGGLKIKKDRKQIIQDIYHTASNMKHFLSENKDKDLQKIFEIAKKLQSEFHRFNEVGAL